MAKALGRKNLHRSVMGLLVYLDTAQLARLERAPDSAKNELLAAWRDAQCELVLTLHHLQEIAQLSGSESILRRLDLLQSFPVIRCRPASEATVLAFEVQLQLYELCGAVTDIRRSALDTLFPLTTVARVREEILSNSAGFRQMRRAYELSANATNTAKQAQRIDGPSMRRTINPSDLAAIDLNRMVEEATAGVPEEARQLVRQVSEQVAESVLEMGSTRRALEHLYGMADLAELRHIPDGDLASAATFFAEAREQVAHVLARLGLSADLSESLVRHLNPYKSPGCALRLAVLRARRLHPKPDEPGDDIDAAHLTFAPYVDLLCVDRRTFGFLTQERRDRPDLLPRSDTSTVVFAGSIRQLTDEIAVRGVWA